MLLQYISEDNLLLGSDYGHADMNDEMGFNSGLQNWRTGESSRRPRRPKSCTTTRGSSPACNACPEEPGKGLRGKPDPAV